MDTTRFAEGDDAFSFLALTANVAFKSPSSISFNLGRWSHCRFVFTHVGCIDVHHPCDGHIKTQLRIQIPAQYHDLDQMKSIINQTFDALSIPLDETYEAVFFAGERQIELGQITNREGISDRI
jgi:hypothetical protein